MLQLIYNVHIHVIMPCVHISTTCYGIHLQLIYDMILIDTINTVISAPLLKYYCSTML